MTERQQEMQQKTAAYEALQFLRRLYPWRIASPLDLAVDRYLTRTRDQLIHEMSTGCLPLLVRR